MNNVIEFMANHPTWDVFGPLVLVCLVAATILFIVDVRRHAITNAPKD